MNITKNEILFASKIYFFTILFASLFISAQSFKYFKAFTLLSNKVLIITEEGIIKYDPETDSLTPIIESNLISSPNDIGLISFAQSPSDEGGYIYCRIKSLIYVLNENLSNNQFFTVEADEISNIYCTLVPYKKINGDITLMVNYIKNGKIKILMYKIDLNQVEISSCIAEVCQKLKNIELNREIDALEKAITCQLIPSINNKLLSCFSIEQQFFNIIACAFDPENNLSLLYFSDNMKKTDGTSIISSIYIDGKVFVCFVDYKEILVCDVYDIQTKLFDDIIKLEDINCGLNTFNMDIKYV